MSWSRPRRALATSFGLALAVTGVGLSAPAHAAADHLVISEVYGGGGNSGATYTHDFIELYNPTDAPISVDGWSVQYRSAGSSTAAGQVTPLTGSVPAKGHYLVQQAVGAGGTQSLPTPDATGTSAMSGTGGQAWLANTTSALTPPAGNVVGTAGIVDFVGANTSAASYESARLTANPANATAATRDAAGTDTDHNGADFSVAAPTPTNSGSGPVDPDPEPEPGTHAIAEIQGTGAASPLVAQTVTTTGVVTAAYPSGGINGFFIQTGGTGGGTDATPGASDGLFVYSPTGVSSVAIGDHVSVTGKVSEYYNSTQVTAAAADIKPVAETASVTPLAAAYPTTDAEREAHEGEPLKPDRRVHGDQQLLHQPVRRDRARHRHHPVVAADREGRCPGRRGHRSREGRQRGARRDARRRRDDELPVRRQRRHPAAVADAGQPGPGRLGCNVAPAGGAGLPQQHV